MGEKNMAAVTGPNLSREWRRARAVYYCDGQSRAVRAPEPEPLQVSCSSISSRPSPLLCEFLPHAPVWAWCICTAPFPPPNTISRPPLHDNVKTAKCFTVIMEPGAIIISNPFIFLVVLGLELRAFTFSHSTSPDFFGMGF
jgi:hypothetical protein